jgi:hypothetical protein
MDMFQKLFSSPAAMLRLAVALCYLALGVYLIVNSSVIYFIDKSYRTLLAAVFIAYGAFRLYRTVNDLKNE